MINNEYNQYDSNSCTQHDKLKILSMICSFKLNKKKICFLCNISKSPMWRNGPLGQNTLCNACGLRYMRINKNNTKKRTI